MPSYSTVTVHGKYTFPNVVTGSNVPSSGVVEFIPSVPVIRDATGNQILAGRVKVRLDASGEFTVELPATDDDTLEPSGFYYTVSAKLDASRLDAFAIELPAATPSVELADLIVIDPDTLDRPIYLGAETPAGAQAKADAAEAAAEAYADASVLATRRRPALRRRRHG